MTSQSRSCSSTRIIFGNVSSSIVLVTFLKLSEHNVHYSYSTSCGANKHKIRIMISCHVKSWVLELLYKVLFGVKSQFY